MQNVPSHVLSLDFGHTQKDRSLTIDRVWMIWSFWPPHDAWQVLERNYPQHPRTAMAKLYLQSEKP